MTHNALKVTLRYIMTIVLVVTVVIILNYALLLFFTRYSPSVKEPARTVESIALELAQNGELSTGTMDMITKNDLWMQLIDPNGDVIYAYHAPPEIANKYSIQDITRFAKSYLNDYPVYTWESGRNILLLGYPPHTIAKYNISLPTNTIQSWPLTVVGIVALNAVLAFLVAMVLGRRVTRPLNRLIDGIFSLNKEQPVHLEERGVYRDLAQSINETAVAIQDKNDTIKRRDAAIRHWIAGISHDVRTPLSMILGYSALMGEDDILPEETRSQAGIITENAVILRDLIANLNMTTLLQQNIHPLTKARVQVAPIVRKAVANCVNSGVLQKCSIEVMVEDECAAALLDEDLFARAVYNLLLNSAKHNADGCRITVTVSGDQEYISIAVADDGCGIPEEEIIRINAQDLDTVDQRSGFGLILVKSIIDSHGGHFRLKSDAGKGTVVTLLIPREDTLS